MATYYVNENTALNYSAKVWTVGERMVPTVGDVSTNHLVAKQWVWECTSSSGTTTSATPPTWAATINAGDTVVDFGGNGTTWTARAPTTWANATRGLYWLGADATTRRIVVGDVVYVHSNHDLDYGVAVTINFPTATLAPTYVICAGDTNEPPTSYANTAWERQTTNVAISYNGNWWWYGVNVQHAGNFTFSNQASTALSNVFKAQFSQTGTATNRGQAFGNTSGGSAIYFTECYFNNTSSASSGVTTSAYQECVFINCTLYRNSSSALFSGTNQNLTFIGCDFSSTGSSSAIIGGNFAQRAKLVNCKLGSINLLGTQGTSSFVEVFNSTNADSTVAYKFRGYAGAIQDSETIYLTTGGSQMKDQGGGLVSYSLELNPDTTVAKSAPLYSPWASVFVGSTGSKTISLKVAYDDATSLTDAECWIEVDYYGDSASPMSTVALSAPVVSGTNCRDINATGSSLTNTSEAWTGTSGWTNKKTHTLSKTVTINQQGYVRARVAVAKDVTVYVDQSITVA